MTRILLLLSLAIISCNSYAQNLTPTEDLALVTFKISDYSEVPEEDALVTVTALDTNLVLKGTSTADGTFQLLLPEGKKYKVSVNKFAEDFDFEKPIDIPKRPGTIKFEHKLKIRIITEYLRTYTLDHVYFDSNKFNIKKQSLPALNLLFSTLKSNGKMKVEIAGHTDDAGDDKDNMLLSQKRADEVMKFLTDRGIAKDRILAKGYGETNPVASNENEAGKQKNRRTEVRVITE